MTNVNRRYFLMSSVALPVAMRARALASPNDTVRVAVVGFNSRGRSHISSYLKIPNVEVAALCDIDASVLAKGVKTVEEAGKKRPATFADFRKVLEDPSIDAVSLATPNFHHTLQTIWGCEAGKDVYVEKPCSYNMFEAQQIVAASRKYNRIVQDGTGAGASLHEAKQRLKEGIIGDVYMARGLCFKWRDTIGRTKQEPVPPGVEYDLWIGPAPAKPFTRNRFHYNWHWQWDYGNGDIGNQGSHQLHAARSAMGVKHPTKISSMGGHFMFDDDQETPNTQVATFEFEDGGKKKLLVFEVRHWITNNEAGIGERSDPQAGAAAGAPETVGNIWYGSKGYMATGRAGWRTFLGQKQEPGPKSEAGGGAGGFANFIDVVRSRKREDQLAEIEEGAISTMLVHLANISYRVGRTLYFDPVTYSCKGDAEATAMFTRSAYRSPFTVPKIAGVNNTSA
ncbi:MAG: gfo/Idh/MocA family oxidoreductase [Luteitalea sp.]|nr:gfo/Idh/MocA family oxidoreductase [Luteitalea sp.]